MATQTPRRAFLTAGLSALATSALGGELLGSNEAAETPVPLGIPLEQEALAWDFAALEPHLDSRSLRLHYHKHHGHHQARLAEVVRRSNIAIGNVATLMGCITTLIEQPSASSVVPLGKKPGPLPLAVQQALREHGGGHLNHTAFWRFLAPAGSGPAGPEGRVLRAIEAHFGTVETFKQAFTEAALRRFGSGWAWLVHQPDGKLVITTTANEDNPLMKDFVDWREVGRPILALDLWEHAYYLRHQQNRAAYIKAWWNVVNWSFVSKAYAIVVSGKI